MAPSANSSRAWKALTPPLSEWILDAVSSMNFKRMTPVQASTIPLFMAHKDVVVEAVTGSGKTLAFLIPIVERLLRLEDPVKRYHVSAIVISPTRELATQIYGVLRSLLAFHGPSAVAMDPSDEDADEPADPNDHRILKVIPQLLVGGDVTPAQDISYFLKNSPNLLISTPGRLLELLQSPHVHCPQSSFEVLVLDEADRLLDLGFKNDLQRILGRLPKQRRTGLFSASVSEAVDQIIRVGLRNPVKVAVKVKSTKGVEDRRTPTSLQLSYLVTRPSHKLPALSCLLAALSPPPQKTIVYLSTCAAVDYFQHILPALLPSSFALLPLHGKHPPKVRQKNFSTFVDAVSPSTLLTTDVAARGLDVREVDLVVQLDPPADPKVFLHRCGRAGRAGRRGLAVVFLHPGREERYVEFLAIRKTPVERLAVPRITVDEADAERACQRIRERVLEDRATHDKAQRAFVSWVRAYGKHQAGSIFRVEGLDWEDLAKGWGLLRLPKMPELKGWEAGSIGKQATVDLGVDVDFDTYAYRDRHRELARLAKASAALPSSSSPSVAAREPRTDQSANHPWSQRISQKSVREQRREKKRTRREKEAWSRKTEKEKDEAKELERMVEAVRRKVREGKRLDRAEGEGEGEGEEFGGFD